MRSWWASTSGRSAAGKSSRSPHSCASTRCSCGCAAPAHPALITEADFVAAQSVDALPRPADGTPRLYRLVGVLRCAFCGRRMNSHWTHGQAWYRCRHGYTSATPATAGQHRTLYVREDRILDAVATALQTHPLGEDVTADDIRAYLRDQDLVAVYDGHTVTLHSELATAAHHDQDQRHRAVKLSIDDP